MRKPPKTNHKWHVSRFVKPCLMALGFTYLGFHVMHGERGLYALVKENARKSVLQEELRSAKKEREYMERMVVSLRDESLDIDLLDEQMRRMMGAAKPEEIIILRDQ